jgi:hypothetical protein
MHYDLSQDTEFGGFQPDYLIPLDFNTTSSRKAALLASRFPR